MTKRMKRRFASQVVRARLLSGLPVVLFTHGSFKTFMPGADGHIWRVR